MRVNTKIVLLIETGEIVSRESFEYQGPVSLAIGVSGQGSKQKSESESASRATQGVAYNEPFLNLMFGQGGQFYGTKDGGEKYTPGVFGYEPDKEAAYVKSAYTPAGYTGGKFTPVAPEGFGRLESNLYGGAQSKLSEAYNQAIARQREERSQAGGLNDPAQYLEGGVRAATDRSYLENLQQAARDAAIQRLGLEEREAGRQTAYDVGQGQLRTAFDMSEAGRQTTYGQREAERETTFNQKQVDDLWLRFQAKLAYALEASKFGVSSAESRGESSGISGGGSASVGKIAN